MFFPNDPTISFSIMRKYKYRVILFILEILSLFVGCTLDAVMLTVGKDGDVFERSITSAMEYLTDVRIFYIICPKVLEIAEKYPDLSNNNRIKFMDESLFPFSHQDVSETMLQAVSEAGKYNLSGRSDFERYLQSRTGWYLQQLIKLYSGFVIPTIEDYLLLDGDLIWLRNVSLINNQLSTKAKGSYFYVSSSQYHSDYLHVYKSLTGYDIFAHPKGLYRSGIVHHMVIVQSVLKSLINRIKKYDLEVHQNRSLPAWKIILRASALQMTCHAPREKLCGSGNVLSEYELYINYALSHHPETISFRPLAWANGPRPGLLYWPEEGSFNQGNRNAWIRKVDKQIGLTSGKFHERCLKIDGDDIRLR